MPNHAFLLTVTGTPPFVTISVTENETTNPRQPDFGSGGANSIMAESWPILALTPQKSRNFERIILCSHKWLGSDTSLLVKRIAPRRIG